MTAGTGELARRVGGAVSVREGGMRVRWVMENLPTLDAHVVRCAFVATVRAREEAVERRALAEVLMGDREVVRAGDVVRHFQRAMECAAARVAADAMAEKVAGKDVQAALVEAARPVAFACGVEVVGPFETTVDCPTLREQRLREAAGRMATGEADEVVVGPGRVYVVAGGAVVGLDVTDLSRATVEDLPAGVLGPLRSVQGATVDGRKALLVGARSGVFVVEAGSAPVAYVDPGITSAHGFNQVVYVPGWHGIVATHSEGGLVRWEVGRTEAPVRVWRPSELGGPARDVRALDESAAVVVAGNGVMVCEGDEVRVVGKVGEVAGVGETAASVVIVEKSGFTWEVGRFTREVRKGRELGVGVTAVAMVGEDRLAVGVEGGGVRVVGLNGGGVDEYRSSYREVRLLAAGAGVIAGVSGDRQRVVVWKMGKGERPMGEVHVGGVVRHRVGDVAVVSET